jgi:hypothetical protein
VIFVRRLCPQTQENGLAVSKGLRFENRDLAPGLTMVPLSLSSIMQIPEDKYEYVPLPTYSANRTRVLRLLPDSNFSSPVRCELQEVSLDEKPAYEAISYC